MPGQRAEPAGDKGPGLGSIDVQIDLLGPVGGAEGRPDALAGAAVRDRDRRERRVRPAKEEARDVHCRRLAIGPDFVERDEQVGEGGATTVPLEVTELVASPRQVVDHDVEHDVVVGGDPPDVGPGAEARVDLAIGGRREAAIRGRRERWQDVHSPEHARQGPRQQRRESGQVPAERIGVREQLRTGGERRGWHLGSVSAGRVTPLTSAGRTAAGHPLTDPCSSAAMMCRWNRRKSTNVGSRMRIVPAQSRGTSVA